jgi:hypothetical protein
MADLLTADAFLQDTASHEALHKPGEEVSYAVGIEQKKIPEGIGSGSGGGKSCRCVRLFQVA